MRGGLKKRAFKAKLMPLSDQWEVVMCIENQDGFNVIEHPDFRPLTEYAAKHAMKMLNSHMSDEEVAFIVGSTMRNKLKSDNEWRMKRRNC